MGKRIPPWVKAECRALFFKYEPVSVIAAKYGLSEKTVGKWVYGYDGQPKEKTWLHQRREQTKELMAEVHDDIAKHYIGKLWRISLPMLVDAVRWRAEAKLPLTIDEAEAVTRILMSFDKLRRLDAEPGAVGALPDAPRPYTMQELQEAITRDKFFAVHLHVHQGQPAPAESPARDVGPALPADPFAPKGDGEP